MKWLLDANLSYRLVRLLANLPIQAMHVSRTGLPVAADDRDIWHWARANNLLLVTNDDDFYRFAGTLGFPLKVVMLRTGNQSTRFLANLLHQHFADIQQLTDSPEAGVLELY
ncbi:MAG: hypothetical protein EOO56_25465 [Hymenobacter sp.]|nr:MAG: hypothetical protein EOO56_25465 [Hymenobacter sp.]